MPVNTDARNDTMVASLRSALRSGDTGLSNVPGLLKRVIKEDSWRHRLIERTGVIAEFDSFIQFVHEQPLEGLGSDIKTLERLCFEDVEALTLLKDVTRQQGHRTDLHNNVMEVKQVQGNSKSYTVHRLERERPDLYEQVLTGDITPNAAAIEAGFRSKTLTIPTDPERAARTIARHFSCDDIQTLIQLLSTTR